jgi:hypothetical protein
MLGNLLTNMAARRRAEPSDLCPAARMIRGPTDAESANVSNNIMSSRYYLLNSP